MRGSSRLALLVWVLAGCGQPLYTGNQNGVFTPVAQSSALGLGRDEDLARASAGSTGCDPSEIHVYNKDAPVFGGTTSWGADCQGRSYRCSGGASVSCVERREARAPAPPPTPRGVRRVKGSSGHYLSLAIKVAPFELTLLGSPAQDRENLLLTIRFPSQLIAGECAPELMVDGQLQPPPGHRNKRSLAQAEIQVQLPFALLQKFVKPHRVAGRVCGEEWRLGAADQTEIEEFLLRWNEELGWKG